MERTITISRQQPALSVTLQPGDTLCMAFEEHSDGPVSYGRYQVHTDAQLAVYKQVAVIGNGAFTSGPAGNNHNMSWSGPRPAPARTSGVLCRTWFRLKTPVKIPVAIRVTLQYYMLGSKEAEGGKLVGEW